MTPREKVTALLSKAEIVRLPVKGSDFKATANKALKTACEPMPAGNTALSLADFRAYMPSHRYIFLPSRELWPAASVNARVGPMVGEDGKLISASAWLDEHQAVEQMIWAPSEPMFMNGQLASHGGWIKHDGCTCLNLYLPPTVVMGNPENAGPWLDHIRKVFPTDADHIVKWMAHRVQKPGEKINHALILGGSQGVGKDTLLEPVKYAVGAWNFQEVSPSQLLGRFNSFVKSVILRVSEARDLGDVNRYSFYDHLKVYTAAPPDFMRCDEKNLREHAVMNVCGVVITTNHKSDGIYLPSDDRRHYVAWSTLTKDDFAGDYWRKLYKWYAVDGFRDVTAYLWSVDLSDFDSKAPPPKTAAFWEIVDANRSPEDGELADVLDLLDNPAATTLILLAQRASDEFREWLQDRRNRRQIPHRLEAVGYAPVRNDTAVDGLWKIGNRRQVVYARFELSVLDRIRAANQICRDGRR